MRANSGAGKLGLGQDGGEPVAEDLAGREGLGLAHHLGDEAGDLLLEGGRAAGLGQDLVAGEAVAQGVDVAGGLAQALLRRRLGQGEDLLADFAALQHQHQQGHAPLGGDQLQVLEACLELLRRGDEAGAMGVLGQYRGGQPHPLVHIAPRLVELVADGAALGQRQLVLADDALDEVAVAGRWARARPRCEAGAGSLFKATISLRTVAELTPRLNRSTMALELTGTAVSTYSRIRSPKSAPAGRRGIRVVQTRSFSLPLVLALSGFEC